MPNSEKAIIKSDAQQLLPEEGKGQGWITNARRRPLILYSITGLGIAFITILYNTLVCARWGVFGFPFDDSWIHLNYARTILEERPFQYAEGIPSTGTSAPLWNFLLVPLLLVGTSTESIVTAVMVFGSILYYVDIVLVGMLVLEITRNTQAGIVGQIVFAFTPRVTGLMLSGMEAPLLFLILFLFLIFVDRKEGKYDLLLGFLAGLAFLCRPEMALLAILCLPLRAAKAWRVRSSKTEWAKQVLKAYAAAGIAVAPWVIWCLATTGFPLSDTIYVKLGWGIPEQGVRIWLGYWEFWITREMPFIFVGLTVGVVLITIFRIYEMALTVTMLLGYQLTMPAMALIFDARYLVPLFVLIGILFVSGSFAFAEIILESQREANPTLWKRNMAITTVVILLLFALTTPAYLHHEEIHANQIQNITEMQVACAHWVDENLPEGTLIAVYDIGAIAFLTDHVIIDLVGLANPYVAHNVTSASERVSYLDSIDCEYLVFYDPWINVLRPAFRAANASLEIVFEVTILQNVVCGTDTMRIWQIHWST